MIIKNKNITNSRIAVTVSKSGADLHQWRRQCFIFLVKTGDPAQETRVASAKDY